MKRIEKILQISGIREVVGNHREDPVRICFNSKDIGPGDMFIAVPGTLTDGHKYIPDAILSGASYIVCETMPLEIEKSVCYIQVENAHVSLGLIASAFYGNPSSYLKLVGVTGTNGKTTIATLLFEMFLSLGYCAGLISTIKTSVNGKESAATHTTPDPVSLQSLLKEMLDAGCEYVFMEVSSHAIHQERIAGLNFAGGIFTNLSHEHLDYHKDFAEYRDTKKQFFDRFSEGAFALTNRDDKNGLFMIQNTPANKFTYGIKGDADFKGTITEMHLEGNLMEINGDELWTRLPGRFNAYNLLAVCGSAILLGAKKEEVLQAISGMNPVEGRFQIIMAKDGPTAIVDYAHTPDALENVLNTIREIRPDDRVITVVGAGGNRDRTKRPLMAKIAAELSNQLILTSDNPRNEEPGEIIAEMRSGLDPVLSKKVISIPGREDAIKTACTLAGERDIILVAGKGHETYQEIGGIRHHFDDREKLKEYLNIS